MGILKESITVLRNALLSNSKVQNLCGDRVKPLIMPHQERDEDGNLNDVGAFIVIAREDFHEEQNQFDTYNETCDMVANAVSVDYDESLELAEAILLEIKKLRNVQHYQIFATSSSEEVLGYEEEGQTRYVQIIKYSFGALRCNN